MPTQNAFARSLHDLGLAGWFGGSLMGAVGLNGATEQIDDPTDRARAADAGWARWVPVNAAAIVAHLLGGGRIVWGNRGRLAVQRQARWVNLTKAALTAVALAATAASRWQGRTLEEVERGAQVPVGDATTPAEGTPPQAAQAQRRLAVLQWVVPATTGALVVLNAKAGEQQRPAAIARDAVRSRIPARVRLAASAAPDVEVPWVKVVGAAIALIASRRVLRRRSRRRSGDTVRTGLTARDVMTSAVVTVSSSDSLAVAAQRMADEGIGAVPVCDGDRLAGMLTDRDIVTKALVNGADTSRVTAGQVAGRQPVTAAPDDPLDEIVRTMARAHVRRLPVVVDDRLVGIISQADVAAAGDDRVTGELVERISSAS